MEKQTTTKKLPLAETEKKKKVYTWNILRNIWRKPENFKDINNDLNKWKVNMFLIRRFDILMMSI